MSSEPPGGAPAAPSRPPRQEPQRPLWKLVALGATVAACVVLALALRARGTSSLEQNVLHGSAGIKRTKDGREVRWHLRTTKVTIDASVDKYGPGATSAVQDAFGTWLGSDQRLPDLSFDTARGTRVKLEPDGKNTVLVAPITLRGHEHDLALTLTYSDEMTGAIVEADIVINAEHAFRVLKPGDGQSGTPAEKERRSSCVAGSDGAKRCQDGAFDLQNIVTHEVGHFFGLGEETADSGATMYYCTSRCETHKRALARVDTDSISALYVGASVDEAEAQSGGCGGARIGTRGSLGEAGLVLGAALLLLRRRRQAR